jgi:hypothetical protein
MGEEDRIENLDTQEYRSLLETLKRPVRDIVCGRSFADLEPPDDILNLLRFG